MLQITHHSRSVLRVKPKTDLAYAGSTIVDGLAVTAPINATMALRDVRETHGSFIAISDETILQAVNTLARRGGLAVETAGAAAFAGIEPVLAAGLFQPHETIVGLATGTGLKNIPPLPDGAKEHLYQIGADLEQVARYQRRV